MENLDIYVNIFFYSVSFIAFMWTIIQSWQLMNRIKKKDVLNQEDLDNLQLMSDEMKAEMKHLNVKLLNNKIEVFDYVEQQLKPIANRLAVRQTREKQRLEAEEPTKRGGIIPFPHKDGTT